MNAQVERFHYSLEYEHALMNLLGPHYYGRAGLAANVSFLKKSMLRAIRKVRDRLRTVTAMDERLELTTSWDLARLEQLVNRLSKYTNNDWDVITSLMSLVGHLLGYDWLDGEIHRHVIFFRDKDQENFDHEKLNPIKDAFYDPVRHLGFRYATVNHLKRKLGLSPNEIAQTMGINEYMVSQILGRISAFERRENTTFPTLEKPEELPVIHQYGYQRKRGDRLVDWRP